MAGEQPAPAQRHRCEACHRPGPLRLGAGTEVEVGTVAAALERRPLVACPAGHDRSPGAALSAGAAAAALQLPLARRRWRRGDRCANCGEALLLPVRRTRRTVTVTGEALPVHTLHLDVPMTRCADCGWDQIPVRSHDDLERAVRAVYLPA